MTNHWNQNRSNFRTGEPKDHLRAKEFIGATCHLSGYDIQYEYPLVDYMEKQAGTNYHHNYDIVAMKYLLVIEIDDPNLHSKPEKKKNDHIAQNAVENWFPLSTFLRLDKYEVNNTDIKGKIEYLDKNFWPSIK